MRRLISRAAWRCVCVVALGGLLAGCGTFWRLKREVKDLEGDYRLVGRVVNLEGDPARVHVFVWRDGDVSEGGGSVEIVDRVSPSVDGTFALFLNPGVKYYVAAFEDANRSDRYDRGERIWFYGKPDPVPLEAGRVGLRLQVKLGRELVGAVPAEMAALRDARGQRRLMEFSRGEQVRVALGEVADIREEDFSSEVGVEGLWEPASFLKERGYGVYFLESYDPAKIPVLFVYGAAGSVQNWRTFFSQLDRDRYQAWFYHYPSGIRLEQAASGLARIVGALERRYEFERLHVVAHSMGGLVARRALQHYVTDGGAETVEKFVTMSTPWNGHEMANLGVERAPEAIPSWHDVRPGSEFILSLFERDLAVEHLLIYTTKASWSPVLPKDNDGAVGVDSQLDARAVGGAVRTQEFELSHVGVLEAEAVVGEVEAFLRE